MSTTTRTGQVALTAADQPRAIASAVILAVIGIALFMAMPVVVGAWSDYAGLSDQQAGLLAAIDSGGGIAASLFVSVILGRVNWRVIAAAGIAIAICANLASIFAASFGQLALCRATAGFGGGMIYALGLAALAATHHTGRNFSILLFTQVSFGMLEINLYPYLAALGGMNGIYLGMAAAFAAALLFVSWLPHSAQERATTFDQIESAGDNATGRLPWLCLGAVFLFYISTGSFWAYIERMGRAGGLATSLITDSLTYTQVLSLLGCVIAGWLSGRIGQSRPLIVSLLCAALAVFSLALGVTKVSFITALCVFFLFWNAIDIYQLGTLGNMDHSGRFAAMVPAFQMTAAAIGPAIAAGLLEWQGSYQSVLLMAGSCTAMAMLVYVYVYLQLRSTRPDLADAA